MHYFEFKNQKLPLNGQTAVMGILNITPDSFSDGGLHFAPKAAVQAAEQMKSCGAAWLDLGAQSTRPGHTPVTAGEEWERLEPVLKPVLALGLPVSVDTFYPEVAQLALQAGCHIINDVSGTLNPEMGQVVARHGAGWVLMHAGTNTAQPNIATEVHGWFLKALQTVSQFGLRPAQICLDPGIGFGKTRQQDLNLIANTNLVKVPGVAYLMAASRKRVIAFADGQQTAPDRRDAGTTAAHTIAAFLGADFVRAHNCFEACQAVRVLNALKLAKI